MYKTCLILNIWEIFSKVTQSIYILQGFAQVQDFYSTVLCKKNPLSCIVPVTDTDRFPELSAVSSFNSGDDINALNKGEAWCSTGEISLYAAFVKSLSYIKLLGLHMGLMNVAGHPSSSEIYSTATARRAQPCNMWYHRPICSITCYTLKSFPWCYFVQISRGQKSHAEKSGAAHAGTACTAWN